MTKGHSLPVTAEAVSKILPRTYVLILRSLYFLSAVEVFGFDTVDVRFWEEEIFFEISWILVAAGDPPKTRQLFHLQIISGCQ